VDLLLAIYPVSNLSWSLDLCAVTQAVPFSKVSGFRLDDLGSNLGMATKYLFETMSRLCQMATKPHIR
jgi:hypothetical protein